MSAPLMILPPQSAQSQVIYKAVKFGGGLYADHPGTGPRGEKCRSCKHYTHKVLSQTYRKCGLTERWWTKGGGTDIKANQPACSKWESAK